jgi:hypothetical protein
MACLRADDVIVLARNPAEYETPGSLLQRRGITPPQTDLSALSIRDSSRFNHLIDHQD